MTAIRHTATLTEWNSEHGIAQADSGTAYPVSHQQLYYAPYQIGSRIQNLYSLFPSTSFMP